MITDSYGYLFLSAEVAGADQEDIDSAPANDDGDQSEDDEANFEVHSNCEPLVDIALEMTPEGPLEVDRNSNFSYQVVLDNQGPDDNSTLQVQLHIPIGLSLVDHTTEFGSFDSQLGAWTISDFVVGEHPSLDLTINATSTGSYELLAQVSTCQAMDIDSNPGNDDGHQSQDDEDALLVLVTDPTQEAVQILDNNNFADPDPADTLSTGHRTSLGLALLNLYPNPAKDILFIEQPSPHFDRYQLYSLQGQIVQQGLLTPGQNEISIERLPQGQYLLQCIGHQSNLSRQVMVVD